MTERDQNKLHPQSLFIADVFCSKQELYFMTQESFSPPVSDTFTWSFHYITFPYSHSTRLCNSLNSLTLFTGRRTAQIS